MRIPAHCAPWCASLAMLLGLSGPPVAVGAAPGEVRPDDARSLFDLGTRLAAGGETAQAEALFQEVTALGDQEAAGRAHYNLGCLAAEKAKTLLGNPPEDAPADVRQRGIEMLGQAAGHFQECLRLDHDHADARHNLEILRLVTARTRRAWGDYGSPQPGPGTTQRQPSEKQPAEKPPNSGSGDQTPKPDPTAGPGDAPKPPANDQQPKPTGDGNQPETAAVAGGPLPKASQTHQTDPATQQAQRLIDLVRQRSREKRQWDKQRRPGSLTQVEEKNW